MYKPARGLQVRGSHADLDLHGRRVPQSENKGPDILPSLDSYSFGLSDKMNRHIGRGEKLGGTLHDHRTLRALYVRIREEDQGPLRLQMNDDRRSEVLTSHAREKRKKEKPKRKERHAQRETPTQNRPCYG